MGHSTSSGKTMANAYEALRRGNVEGYNRAVEETERANAAREEAERTARVNARQERRQANVDENNRNREIEQAVRKAQFVSTAPGNGRMEVEGAGSVSFEMGAKQNGVSRTVIRLKPAKGRARNTTVHVRSEREARQAAHRALLEQAQRWRFS